MHPRAWILLGATVEMLGVGLAVWPLVARGAWSLPWLAAGVPVALAGMGLVMYGLWQRVKEEIVKTGGAAR